MQKLITPFLFAIAFISSQTLFSQCADGEMSVQLVVSTDAWGYESYWELVPFGQECGSGDVLLAGGNMNVGCDAQGTGASETITMGNNSVYVSEETCVTAGSQVDLIHVDSYGDGGTDFNVLIDGVESYFFEGAGVGETFTIDVVSLSNVPHDVPCDAYPIQTDGVSALLSNSGASVSYYEIAPENVGCNTPGSWCELNVTNTIWAKFTVEEGVRYHVYTCNDDTNFDTQIALWTVGSCNDFDSYELVNSNDDSGCDVGNGYASSTYSPCLPGGTDVYVQIDGWNGAVGIAQLTVEEYTDEPIYYSNSNNITCALETDFNPDGSISVYSINDGITSVASWVGPFGYTGTGSHIENLLPGEYTVEVQSTCPNSVSYTETFEIINPEPLELEVDVVSSCENGTGGSIHLDIIGGTGGYDIFWEGPESMESEEQNLLSVESGDYSVYVEDEQGCYNTLDVELPYVGVSPYSLGEDMFMCAGDMNFFFGPNGNYSYEWQDGSTSSVYILQTEEGMPTTAVVGVSVVNEFGCELSDAIVITVEDCTGVDEAVNSSWGLSPNPASTSLTLNINGVTNGSTAVIRDYQGRVVKQETASQIMVWDVSSLNSGFYLVEVVDENGFVVWQSKAIVE